MDILKLHKSPISQNQKDKRWRTRLPNGKQVVKTRYSDLIDTLMEYYSGLQQEPQLSPGQDLPPQQEAANSCVLPAQSSSPTDSPTLQKIYPQWLELRKLEVSTSTLADDISNWEKYIAPTDISGIPLQELSHGILKKWACEIITGNSMKRKYYSNIRTVLNSLLNYAVSEEYIKTNNYKEVGINKRLFKPDTCREDLEDVFTEQEQELIMEEAESDSAATHSALPLGICILFLTGMRIGELCGLRYGDIKDGSLQIRRMVVEKQVETPDGCRSSGYQLVDHTKSSAGQRSIPLTAKAQHYFNQIRDLNAENGYPTSDGDLIFQRGGALCNQRVFDSRLRKYCGPRHLNLPFTKSCHDIRRTYISSLFTIPGLTPDDIRRIAGHENIEMTLKYCRSRKTLGEINAILEASNWAS